MKKILLPIIIFLFAVLFPTGSAWAMPVGTLLYRTSGDNKLYGLNTLDLITSEKGKLAHIYSGHAAIYVGREDGIDYIVEMQPKGAIKVPAKYFINSAAGEKLVAAKIPKEATPLQIATAVAIAKNLALNNAAYDFDFRKQKGPNSGDWTCVGLTEKIYESANISNPTNYNSLEYDNAYYAIDITPDGYDHYSIYNSSGDCFSSDLEYSKIAAKNDMIIPAPEIFGYDIGLEKNGERYLFLPYTQAVQNTLKDVDVDIPLSSSFPEPEIRGSSPILALVLKWSFINNPISSIKNIAKKAESTFLAFKEKVFPDNSIAFADEAVVTTTTAKSVNMSSAIKASSTTKSTNTAANKTALSKATVSKITAAKTAVSKAVATSSKITVAKNLPSSTNTNKEVLAKNDNSTSSAPVIPIKTIVNTATVSNSIPRTTIRPTQPIVNNVANNPINITPTTTNSNNINNNQNPSTTTVTIISDPIPNTSSSSDETIEPEPAVVPEKPIALIAKVYSNDSDDWLEIVNTSDFDFDLAEAGYRLEKAKTGADPTLVMRIGDENDGIYPGGTIIKAHDKYLIVNDEGSPEMLAQADAVAIKDTFSWTDDSYTLYLGIASISSDSDVDIIDKIGYGVAKYYEGSPAPALKKGYALERKASAASTLESMMAGGLEEFWPRLFDSDDNSADFILIPFDLALIDSENSEPENNTSANANLYVAPTGLDSENMTQLWHFDECYGTVAYNEFQKSGLLPVDLKQTGDWTVGKWGCAAHLSYYSTSTKAVFTENLDPNQMTMNFYYRNHDSSVGYSVNFYNPADNGRSASIEFTPYFTVVNGFPGFSGRIYEAKWPNDNKWHQVSLVVNRMNNIWSLYLDAQEVYHYEYTGIMPDFKYLDIVGTTVDKTDFDELSFWNRSLPLSELKTINILDQPFNPYQWPTSQREAQLMHQWNFDENLGTLTHDLVGQSNIAVEVGQWDMEGASSSALVLGSKVKADFTEIPINDLSLSFWWRNISSGNEGRLLMNLKEETSSLMSFRPTPFNSDFGFSVCGGIFARYPDTYIPNDKNWHHFALTYDSYRYLFKLYVDGEEKYSQECIKLQEGRYIDGLEISQDNMPSSIDELKIWNGVLFPDQVKSEYEALKKIDISTPPPPPDPVW